MKKCLICFKEFVPKKTARKGILCSIMCRQKWISITTAKKRGDKLRRTGDPKNYIKRGGRHEHRVVAEEKIGRSLKKGEVVHHINGIKSDNSPENLIVMTQSLHIKTHMIKGKLNGKLNGRPKKSI